MKKKIIKFIKKPRWQQKNDKIKKSQKRQKKRKNKQIKK